MIITIQNEIFNMNYVAHIYIGYNSNLYITFSNGETRIIKMRSKAEAEKEIQMINLHLKLKK